MKLLSKYDRQLLIAGLKFETSRSGGKGGQHVNKTESKVTLVFNVRESKTLSESQKSRIEFNLATRIKSGSLRISAENNRSQFRNKSEAISRFLHLLEKALHKTKYRIPTKTPKSVKRKRLQDKKRNQEKKTLRKKVRKSDF